MSLTELNQAEEEEIRGEVVRILKTSEGVKSNLTRVEIERLAFDNIRKDECLTIIKADKGNAVVIMTTEDYNQKLHEVLNDPAFKKIKKAPTAKIERTLATLIKATDWSDDMRLTLPPRTSGLQGCMDCPGFIKWGAC